MAKRKVVSGPPTYVPTDIANRRIEVSDADVFGQREAEEAALKLKQKAESIVDASGYPTVAIELLDNNPFQPRRSVERNLQKLIDEIRKRGFRGVLLGRRNPDEPGRIQLAYGHRRREAAKRAGLTAIPVLIADLLDEDMQVLALNENLLREDLTPIEEARTYQMMIERGYTQQAVADEIHESRGYVRNRLELLDTPDIVQELLEEKPDTIRAAYYLKEVKDEEILAQVVQALLAEDINGMQVQSYVEAATARKEGAQRVVREREQQVAQEPAAAASDVSSSAPSIPSVAGEAQGQVFPSERVVSEVVSLPVSRSAALEPGQTEDEPAAVLASPVYSAPVVEWHDEVQRKSLAAVSKLSTTWKQLNKYREDLRERLEDQTSESVVSKDEWDLLKSINAVVQSILSWQNGIPEEENPGERVAD
jgi:ParB family transcriptional regulator, chromosome partitioning protein